MAIYKLIQNSPLEPEDIRRLVEAYELTLRSLSIKESDDPLTRLIAKKIIEIGQTRIEDPKEISKLALKQLGIQ